MPFQSIASFQAARRFAARVSTKSQGTSAVIQSMAVAGTAARLRRSRWRGRAREPQDPVARPHQPQLFPGDPLERAGVVAQLRDGAGQPLVFRLQALDVAMEAL